MKEKVQTVEIIELFDHPRNIFRQMNEQELTELKESIKQYGLIHPLVVRPVKDGYQVLSGHQRKRALVELGEETAPVIIKELSDEEAEIVLIDANIQTRSLSPMELAKAIRRKKEIIFGGQNDHLKKNCKEGGEKGVKTRDVIAKEMGISPRAVDRYDKLNDLIEPLQDMVDEKLLTLSTAQQIASFEPEIQQAIFDILGTEIKTFQAKELRKIREENDRGHLVLGVLQKQLESLEAELNEYKTAGEDKKHVIAEIRRLQQKKKTLEYELADTQAAVRATREREEKTGAQLIKLLERLTKELRIEQTKMETLLETLVKEDRLDPTNRAYCLQMAQVFGDWERFIVASLQYPGKNTVTNKSERTPLALTSKGV